MSYILWVSILTACLLSTIFVFYIYKNAILVKYENKDILIGKAYNRNFLNFLYRSFDAQDNPIVPFEKRDMNYSYSDSINSSRPLLVESFRWTKFPSINRYIYFDKNKIKNAKYLYFYRCRIGTKDKLFALTADKTPSKIFLFLDILKEIAPIFLGSCLFLYGAIVWVIRKGYIMEGTDNFFPISMIFLLILLLIVIII